MKINNKYIFILLFVFITNTLFPNSYANKEMNDTNIVEFFSLSTNLGIAISSNGREKNIDDNNILIGNTNGFYPSINFNILLRFCNRLKINTGINFQKYKITGSMVSREYIGLDSLKYDNLQYKYFDETIYITSVSIPIRRSHRWDFKNKKSGMILEYGILLVIPIDVSTEYSYQKYGDIEKQISFKNKRQLSIGFIDAQFGLFHKVSKNIDCYFSYNFCATTSIVKDDDIFLSINTLEFGFKYNL
jgi:hypothetical protein